MGWQDIVAALLVTLISLSGVLITAITLPGLWTALLLTLPIWLWRPEMFSEWTIGAVVVLGLIGEGAEFFASAAGAAKTGGSKSGAIGSIVGALIGAVVGTPFFPIIGTIVGAVLGAGVGAIVMERGVAGRTWRESARVGKGAAVGRALSVVIKTGITTIAAVVLIVDAWWP